MIPVIQTSTATYARYAHPKPVDLNRLSVTSVGHYTGKSGFKCSRLKGHHVQHLLYVLRGSARAEIAGQRSRSAPGSLWFTPKDQPYEYWIDPACDEWEGYWIEYDGLWARELWAMTGLVGVTHVPDCFEARPVVEELHRQVLDGTPAGMHAAAALLWRLFAVAEARLAGQRAQADSAQAGIERAQQHVREHLAEALALRDLARVARMSPYHFARIFRERTGFAPAAYVRMVRINRAQELLRGGAASIKQVGPAVGIPTPQHFSAVFKKVTGQSPRAFVRLHRNR